MNLNLHTIKQTFNTLPDWVAMETLLAKLAKSYARRFNVEVFEFVWVSESHESGLQWIPLGRHVDYALNPPPFSPPRWSTGLFYHAYKAKREVMATNLRSLAKGDIEEVTEIFTGIKIKKDEYFAGHKKTEEELVVPLIVKGNVVGLMNLEAFQKDKIKQETVNELLDIATPLARIIDAAEYDRERREEISKYVDDLQFGDERQAVLGHLCFLARPFKSEFVAVEDELVKVAKSFGLNVRVVDPNPENLSIFHDILGQIADSIFSVVDVTELNPNVLIELGIIIGLQKPVLILQNSSHKKVKLPFDIQSVPIFRYNTFEEPSGRQKIDLGESFLEKFKMMFKDHRKP